MVLKALVVDDSSVMRKMVMKAVTETELAEFEFEEADDGANGLDMIRAQKFKVAFIDWNMPNMSGIELVREVRKFADDTELLLIMVTSEKAGSKVSEAINQAGADGYVGKPFTKEDMHLKLKRLLPRIGAL